MKFILTHQIIYYIKEINKLSEVVALSQNKITNFLVIKEKIYYINNTNKIVYYD